MLEKFNQYLEVEKRYSDHTVTAYMNDIESFLSFAEIKSNNDLKETTHQIIRAWIVDLIESKISNRSVNRKLSSLRTYFLWNKRENIIETNPCSKVVGPKQSKRLPEFVKETEIVEAKMEEIFSTDYHGVRDRLIFELLYQTGMRLSELINVKETDIQNAQIRVLGKRNKERIIPISPQLSDLVNDYRILKRENEHFDSFLVLTNKGKKLYPKFVYRKINNYLSSVTSLGKRSPHVLRHTFATHMLNNGAGLETLKDVLGHANLSATQVYTHNSFDKINSIYKQAHPRGGHKTN